MSHAISSWENKVVPYVPLCPYPAFQNAVRDAAISFCEETYRWTFTLDRINVVANQANYTLTIPVAQYGEVIGIDEVKYKQDGMADSQFTTLDPMSEPMENRDRSGSWKFMTATTPSAYYLDNDKVLYLWRTPTVASTLGLLVSVILRPTEDCTDLADFLWHDWREAIADGAKGILLAQKAQPWFDPNLSDAYSSGFWAKVNEAKRVKYHGNVKRKSQVRMREWV